MAFLTFSFANKQTSLQKFTENKRIYTIPDSILCRASFGARGQPDRLKQEREDALVMSTVSNIRLGFYALLSYTTTEMEKERYSLLL